MIVVEDASHPWFQHGKTPLHEAAANNYKDFAELLISKGADVNAKDNVSTVFI